MKWQLLLCVVIIIKIEKNIKKVFLNNPFSLPFEQFMILFL
jgi:hypothetical protein